MSAESTGSSGKGRAVSKDLISIRTYVIPETVPTEIVFSQHMMRFVGLKLFSAGPDLIWGVQGTTSLNSADAYASLDAQHLKRKLYQVELSYRLHGLPPAGTSVTEEFANSAGYLHCSRLTSAFRKSLKDRMLTWLAEDEDAEIDELAALDFEELTKHRPMMIHRLMKESPHINTVIHSVFLTGGVSLRIATLRNIPENIVRVGTRFHEEIKTTV